MIRNVESFVMEGFSTLRQEWEARNDYNAGKTSRFRRTRPGVGIIPRHADYHYRLEIEFYRMLEWMRELDRNDPIVGPGVGRAVDNIVLTGMTPEPKTPDKGLNRALKTRWDAWAGDPKQVDIQGEADFHELEELATRAMLVEGDLSVLPIRRDGSLECLEAHRLRTPLRTRLNIVHGVELDSDRRRQAYWFTGEDINPLSIGLRIGDVQRVPAFDRDGWPNVFHLYRRRRLSQTRGVSSLAPAIDIASMWDDLNFATLVKAQVSAAFAIITEVNGSAPGMPGQSAANTPANNVETTAAGNIRNLQGVSPGMQVRGKPGETIKGFSPNVPNPEFFPYSTLLLTILGLNLGVPVTVLLLDPRLAGNFSSLRGVMDQAKLGFAAARRPLIKRFHRPTWNFRSLWLATSRRPEDRAFARAYRRLGPSYFTCRWRHPRYPYLEPVADRAARILGTRNLLNSPRQCAAEDSADWQEIVTETVEDNSFAIVAALQKAETVNLAFPNAGVTWRDVLTLPTPDQVNFSVSGKDMLGQDPATIGNDASGPASRLLLSSPSTNGHRH